MAEDGCSKQPLLMRSERGSAQLCNREDGRGSKRPDELDNSRGTSVDDGDQRTMPSSMQKNQTKDKGLWKKRKNKTSTKTRRSSEELRDLRIQGEVYERSPDQK